VRAGRAADKRRARPISLHWHRPSGSWSSERAAPARAAAAQSVEHTKRGRVMRPDVVEYPSCPEQMQESAVHEHREHRQRGRHEGGSAGSVSSRNTAGIGPARTAACPPGPSVCRETGRTCRCTRDDGWGHYRRVADHRSRRRAPDRRAVT
jgi:hypothetical protein